ncbi:MAG: TonB-dependent receptor [Gemmatimonadetes bacterium]|nr:TonB-dependent receptor [Gemmatimonadota bacterium]
MSVRNPAGARCASGSRAASRRARRRITRIVTTALVSVAVPASLIAQAGRTAADSMRRDSVTQLIGMRVTAERDVKPSITRLTLPVTASTTAAAAHRQVNAVDVPDIVKYLPSLFVRKRNFGDTQATLATRVWGVSSSARSVILADGVPLSAYIANNNTIGGPRWGLLAPDEVARVDVMHGPFSAAYAGNSMGAVMEISTRQPERREGALTQTQAWQAFSLYGTKATYPTTQTSARIADRIGKLTLSLSGNYQDSRSQPLTYVTAGTFPSGTTGGYAATNKLNAAANVLGATGLLSTQMTNVTGKVGYDLAKGVKLAYTYSFWQNDATAGVDTWLQRSGTPTFGGAAGFASGNYDLLQQHSAQSVSLRTDRRADWDWELVGAQYRMNTDRQRFSTSASSTGTTFGTAGRVAVLSGTGWGSVDGKGAWHKGGLSARHIVTFGAHLDQYRLFNPTYNTADWTVGTPTTVATEGDGRTRTVALWAQEQWRLTDRLQLTAGARWEQWRAFDGLNVNGNTRVVQKEVELSRVSPKASLRFSPTADWLVSASVGKAYRFATAAELYQLVSTGVTFTSPDPNLKPDNVLASELRVEKTFPRGRVQVALFQDNVRDAIIAQFKPLVPGSNTFFSYVSNVDKVRARGVELVLGSQDLGVAGLDLSGSATYLDARTLATSGRASATAPADAAIGKKLPNIPDWRASFAATYTPTWQPLARLSVTAAGRYSGALWTTLDNADVNPNVYQGFSAWFVADAKARVRITPKASLAVGVDNVLNRKYFLFHPFPQRTVVTSLNLGF